MKEILKEIVERTYSACREEGMFTTPGMPDFVVEVPRNKSHGDLAVNLAMVLAKSEKRPPREIALALLDNIKDDTGVIEKMEIAGPGFINFYLKETVWHTVLKRIEEEADRFGSCTMGNGTKIMIEFVSANPTGPLHIGHGRGAAVGDAVANILAFAGYEVEREYYINDVGVQMQNLGKSVFLRYCELLKKEVPFPDGLYRGSYIYGIAKEMILKHGGTLLETPEQEAVGLCTAFASRRILKDIQNDLELFGVHFDTWFSEKALFDSNDVQASIAYFKDRGLAYEKDGALWFKASEYGDEKDRVMIKEDGNTTYFTSDIAYHQNKFKRGFNHVVDIWGADHHGYIPRVRSFLSALDINQDAFHVILVQMVNLLRDGKPVAMSTRAGEFVTLREVIDEVGTDAARFIFLTRRSDAQLDFDLDVAKKQNDENPVYYVQYAHARICSIISFAEEKDFAVPSFDDIDTALLCELEEIDLVKKLSHFPEVIEGSARSYEPHRIAAYLQELVAQFHSYYNKHRVITDNRDLSTARLFLMSGIKRVLNNGLSLLGVYAPTKM